MHNLGSKISLPLMIKAGRISERKKESNDSKTATNHQGERKSHASITSGAGGGGGG